ncbi:hypothetical protein OsJ_35535 [Oryza sativa Japonica Group]|uniref:Dirigent protein n=1 Tax=Oryza sativa subsp. japonica TaxID=39947 RepID=A3CFT0_ORYSJ|nr:hypothetical protein OsJ_35535 [Oryza sativa Japonica Group]
MSASNNKLQFTPRSSLFQGNEINFSMLYLHHTPAGPRPDQSGLTGNNRETGLGPLVVNNWPVYDGIGRDAKVVARAQGLHIYAGNWHNSFSLVFKDERSGSTLEVMGIVVERGEWAIVGGTGQFAMANGVIFKKFHEQKQEGNIMELTIQGFCPVLKGSQIEFGSSELLKEVSGTYGLYEGWKVIRSIKFVTNKKPYGPFGR